MNRRSRLERLEAGKTATTAIPTIRHGMSMAEAAAAWNATLLASPRLPVPPATPPAALAAAAAAYAATLLE